MGVGTYQDNRSTPGSGRQAQKSTCRTVKARTPTPATERRRVEHTRSEVTRSEETRSEETMDDRTNFSSRNTNLSTSAVCRRCSFHPASPRIVGYCSWDCYEADDDVAEIRVEDDLEGDKAAWGAAFARA